MPTASEWKIIFGAVLVLAFLGVFALSYEKGYERCQKDQNARAFAAAVQEQKTAISAEDDEMLAVNLRNQQQSRLTSTIQASHEKDDDAPAPALIGSAIAGLYAEPAR